MSCSAVVTVVLFPRRPLCAGVFNVCLVVCILLGSYWVVHSIWKLALLNDLRSALVEERVCDPPSRCTPWMLLLLLLYRAPPCPSRAHPAPAAHSTSRLRCCHWFPACGCRW